MVLATIYGVGNIRYDVGITGYCVGNTRYGVGNTGYSALANVAYCRQIQEHIKVYVRA